MGPISIGWSKTSAFKAATLQGLGLVVRASLGSPSTMNLMRSYRTAKPVW